MKSKNGRPIVDHPFQTVSVGPDIVLRMRVSSDTVADKSTTQTNKMQPIVVLPSGEMTPFEIALEWAYQGDALVLASDGISRVSIIDPQYELPQVEFH